MMESEPNATPSFTRASSSPHPAPGAAVMLGRATTRYCPVAGVTAKPLKSAAEETVNQIRGFMSVPPDFQSIRR
ncbi:MAG: hypothetical protein ACKVOJ_03830 [Sphingomonadaceae bacterium]